MEKKRTQWNQDEINYIINNYKTKTNKQMAENLNRTQTAVELKTRRLGLKRPKIREYDESKFLEINDEESAYWLGFIMADGYIVYDTLARNYELGIELKDIDDNHLKKFIQFMNANAELTYRKRKAKHFNNIYTNTCLVRIYNKNIVDNLIKHGIEPRKTGKEVLPNIDGSFFMPFLRGFFDGDGSIYNDKNTKFYQTNITCINEDFLVNIREILYSQYGIFSYITKYINSYKTEMYQLHIYKKEENVKFLDLLYRNSKIHLDRKYKLYLKNCLINQK